MRGIRTSVSCLGDTSGCPERTSMTQAATCEVEGRAPLSGLRARSGEWAQLRDYGRAAMAAHPLHVHQRRGAQPVALLQQPPILRSACHSYLLQLLCSAHRKPEPMHASKPVL